MDRPPARATPAFTMAALTAGLGVYGYMSKRSMPSLVAGVAFGAVYAASGYLINNGRDEYGHIVGSAATTRTGRAGVAQPARGVSGGAI
ncbi:hypothetical protein FNF27_08062 [Cafeteria roenbergensis]|uniref:Uncharacterized protein n=1 Tax=Cafeteria roenbergensis TaxID=33653 RepID=A0A5A8DAA2_CAFRO|nr:hypothetical protein FNF27_08062 [Cafeteria roenbergensis]